VVRLLAEDGGIGCADVSPAAENDDFGAVRFDARADEQLLDSGRGARRETARVAEHQLADVEGWKPSTSLPGATGR